jgi:serine protease
MDDENPHNQSAAAPSFFALKLSENTQKNAKHNYLPVIAAILDRAIKGSGTDIRVKPFLSPEIVETVSALIARAVCMDFDYKPTDFEAWYEVQIPAYHSEGPEVLEQQQQLLLLLQQCDVADELVSRLKGPGFPEVESAHILRLASFPRPTSLIPNPPNDQPNFLEEDSVGINTQPSYLDPAPVGIDARYAWAYPGNGGNSGHGEGVGFVDMEQGWDFSNTDLPTLPPLIWGQNYQDFPHGTGVLGVVLMDDNGIASKANGRVVSQIPSVGPPVPNVMEAILTAIATMEFGDVLLLEAQVQYPKSLGPYMAVEVNQSTYEAIRLATALGVVVVEAAGDGGISLDDVTDTGTSIGVNIFNREVRDSGAIIVGAANYQVPHQRTTGYTGDDEGGSCYGSRVDLYAWGNNVYSTAPPPDNFNTKLTDTSSAAAIIAGAALVLQSLAGEMYSTMPPGYRFSPREVRYLLAQGGTKSVILAPHGTEISNLIGVMPDLRTVIDQYLNLAPDIYMRDHVGDDGSRVNSNPLDPNRQNPNCIMQSPDIIVQPSAVNDPTAQFGNDSNTISSSVQFGQDNYIYLRLLNRGGLPATNVSVDVYWALPATVPTPDTWNKIGTATVSSVPNQNVLTVLDAILWPEEDVPNESNLSFIAVATSDQDPAPFTVSPDSNADFNENFLNIIANNNNIAVCSLIVIPSAPDEPQLRHLLPFNIPCNWDAKKKHVIESLGNLPRGSEVRLRLPLSLVRQLHIQLHDSCGEEDWAEIRLPPLARYRIGEGVLQSCIVAQCKLEVLLPEDTYQRPGRFEFAVRQLYGGREIGRLTWRFGKPTSPPCG